MKLLVELLFEDFIEDFESVFFDYTILRTQFNCYDPENNSLKKKKNKAKQRQLMVGLY